MQTLLIKKPVPTEITWHELTQWRNIKDLKDYYPEVFDRWKEKDKIPQWVLRMMEYEQL